MIKLITNALLLISGPIFGGRFVKTLGFPWLMRTIGIINVSYCFLLIFLSKVSNDKTDKVQYFKVKYIAASNVFEFSDKQRAICDRL